MKIQITFFNCKDEQTLEKYISDMTSSGAEIIDSYLNLQPDGTSELGFVIAQVEDIRVFLKSFDKTESTNYTQNLYLLPENLNPTQENESLSKKEHQS
jgi:hypothetical protein